MENKSYYIYIKFYIIIIIIYKVIRNENDKYMSAAQLECFWYGYSVKLNLLSVNFRNLLQSLVLAEGTGSGISLSLNQKLKLVTGITSLIFMRAWYLRNSIAAVEVEELCKSNRID